ncbi:MAG: hypothetical protein ACI8SI_002517 [Congregibacter sp.]|jgi:hypothetical protein
MGAVFQLKQLSDFIQTEPQPLGGSNEVKARQCLLVVMTNADLGFFRFSRQPSALVITDGFHPHTGGLGQYTDSH